MVFNVARDVSKHGIAAGSVRKHTGNNTKTYVPRIVLVFHALRFRWRVNARFNHIKTKLVEGSKHIVSRFAGGRGVRCHGVSTAEADS